MAADDGFREIQLNGKQLVFLFMATTVVAVVIFLCGVMVGRGVKGGTQAAVTTEALTPPPPDAAPGDGQAASNPSGVNSQLAGTPPGQGSPGSGDSTPPANADDLKKPVLPAEPPPESPDDGPVAPPAAATTQPATQVASKLPTPPADTARDGWVVQVAALAQQGQAESIAKRLVSKGFDAYVVPPPPGGGMYRVRVGKFKERRDADSVMRRLEKEEQFSGVWITR